MATVGTITCRPVIVDSDGRTGAPELTLAGTPVTVDADFLTAVDALVAESGATDGSKMLFGAIERVQLVIEIVPASAPVASFGDVRVGWETKYPSDTKRTWPARNTAAALTTVESKGEFADKTHAAFTAWFQAVHSAPPLGLGAVDPFDNSSPASASLAVRAKSSSRARPRV